MSEFTIRGYRGEDEERLVAAWNEALPYDPVDAQVLRRKVLLDPNFDPDGLLVAEVDSEPAGLCLCLMRRVPLAEVGLEPDRGWITAFGVRPERRGRGLGSALLSAALDLFRSAHRTQVAVAPYVPNYFVPGVDVVRYAAGLEFLRRRGFEQVAEALSLDANLVLLDLAPWRARAAALAEGGVEVRPLRPGELPALMSFLAAHMPADWVRHAREVFTDAARGLADWRQLTVALRGGEVVGYCQFEGEHFGPFGVRDDLQGQGIGSVLLARCLQTMREAGHHNAWVLWTSDRAAQGIYARFGFRETRRFAVLRKLL